MEPFIFRQYVRCIDSKGSFADGTPLNLIEGKKYQVKQVKECRGYILIELFMKTGLFMSDRFLSERVYKELENEIHQTMK